MSSRDDVRKAVDSAVGSVLARMRADLVDQVVAGIPEPPPPPPQVAAPPEPSESLVDVGALRSEAFALLDGNGQVEILNRLMDSIATWWDRSVLFLVKGNAYQPWDARGFEHHGGNASVKTLVVNEGSDTILDAALTGAGAQAGNHILESRLGAHRGARAAVPLGIRNKAAAIVYVDGPRHDARTSVAALEILARVGASAIELGMLTKRTPPFVRSDAALAPSGMTAPVAAAPAATGFAIAEPEPEIEMEVEDVPAPPPPRPAPVAAPPAPAPSFSMPAPAPAAPAPAAFTPPPPAAPSFTMPAPAAAPAPVSTAPSAFAMPAPAAPPPAVAPPVHAAPAAPAHPPAAPAHAPAAHSEPAAVQGTGIEGGTLDPRELLKGGAKPVVDAGQAMSSSKTFSRWKPVRDAKGAEEIDPALAAVPEAERPKHVEARKIARLLVSEIKLYNEAKVAVGRKNKDLYERLKDDIERSRQTYNERIDAGVASKTNYFKDELVATLGEGDAASLGPGLK